MTATMRKLPAAVEAAVDAWKAGKLDEYERLFAALSPKRQAKVTEMTRAIIPAADEPSRSPKEGRFDFLDSYDTPEEKIRELKRQLNEANNRARRHTTSQAFLEEAMKQALEGVEFDVTMPKPPAAQPKKLQESAILHLSDIHFGKRTPKYNFEVAKAHVKQIQDKTVQVVRARRSFADVSEIHVLLGGDMIEGQDIFPGQAHELDEDLFQQACAQGPETIAKMLLVLLGEFQKVHIAAVPGNHGRIGGKRQGNDPRVNFDTIFAQNVMMLTENMLLRDPKNGAPRLKDITWDLPHQRIEDWWALTRVRGYGCLLIHGHQIKGSSYGGIPWYRASSNAKSYVDIVEGQGWDYLFMGHYHTMCKFDLNHRKVIVNGSTEMMNLHARSDLAVTGRPAQRLMFVDADHGLKAEEELLLGPPRSPNR